MIARASSGSRSCSSSVDPLMSANSAVTVLRSPLAADASSDAVTRTDGFAASTDVAASAAAASDAPQSAQNFAPNALSEPHFEHRFGRGLPHSAQNFLTILLSVPHFVQRIATTFSQADGKVSCLDRLIHRLGGAKSTQRLNRDKNEKMLEPDFGPAPTAVQIGRCGYPCPCRSPRCARNRATIVLRKDRR